jgi:hypothetical protein
MMNRILVILILTYSSTTFGQFSRNGLMINGTILLNSELNPHSTTGYPSKTINSFAIKPSVGLLINKNFEIGGQVGYSILNREENVRSTYLDFKTTSVSAGIYGQRYFTLSRKLYLTIFASITFSSGTDNYIGKLPITADISTEQSKNFQFSTSIRPTIIFFPIPKFGIQGGLGSIRYLSSENLRTDDKQNDIEISHLPITLGLTYYIDKKKRE